MEKRQPELLRDAPLKSGIYFAANSPGAGFETSRWRQLENK